MVVNKNQRQKNKLQVMVMFSYTSFYYYLYLSSYQNHYVFILFPQLHLLNITCNLVPKRVLHDFSLSQLKTKKTLSARPWFLPKSFVKFAFEFDKRKLSSWQHR